MLKLRIKGEKMVLKHNINTSSKNLRGSSTQRRQYMLTEQRVFCLLFVFPSIPKGGTIGNVLSLMENMIGGIGKIKSSGNGA